VKALRQAVSPPGQAFPAWKILCRIARKMGLAGFDFTGVEDIRAEMADLAGNFQVNNQIDWLSISPHLLIESGHLSDSRGQTLLSAEQLPTDQQPTQDTYMGFPLTQYVQGLKLLTSVKTRKNDG